ncbi:MAG: sugar ABC transporter permease [Planctomycetota bacterium]|jgi:D-xylose transport system permease protein
MNEQSPLKSFLKEHIHSLAILAALLLIALVFTYLTEGSFLAPRNLSNLFRQMAVISFLSVGMVLVIVSGNIDLSVGSVAGFTGAVAAMIQVKWLGPWLASAFPNLDPSGQSWIIAGLAVGGALACGLLIGLFQGFWVAFCGVPAFIVTLAGMLIFRGGILGVTRGVTIAPMDPLFKDIGQSYLSFSAGWILGALAVLVIAILAVRSRLLGERYGMKQRSMGVFILLSGLSCAAILLFVLLMNLYKGIPLPLLLLALATLFMQFIARQTTLGRHIFAIGGNREAARLSGINIRAKILWAFAVMGMLSAVSGIVLTARLDAATTNAGMMFELSAIAACVIGGTSLMGGKGSILGAILGGLVMASLDNGMSLMNVEIFWQQIIKGLVLLFAVWLDISIRGRKA